MITVTCPYWLAIQKKRASDRGNGDEDQGVGFGSCIKMQCGSGMQRDRRDRWGKEKSRVA